MKITLLVEGARHTVDLTEEGITLGRGDAASIKVTSNAVSRQHARIFLKDGRPHVVDLKSLNGTTLNGEPVPVPSAMRPGDVVLMGEIPVQWLAEAAPESISGGFQANPLWSKARSSRLMRDWVAPLGWPAAPSAHPRKWKPSSRTLPPWRAACCGPRGRPSCWNPS